MEPHIEKNEDFDRAVGAFLFLLLAGMFVAICVLFSQVNNKLNVPPPGCYFQALMSGAGAPQIQLKDPTSEGQFLAIICKKGMFASMASTTAK